jgi:hypothetical protein
MEKARVHRASMLLMFVVALSMGTTGAAFSSIPIVPAVRSMQQHTTRTTHHVAFLPIMGNVKPVPTTTTKDDPSLTEPLATMTKCSMMAFIASMCLALPITLFPTWVLFQAGLISTLQKEQWSLQTAERCARGLFTIRPFAKLPFDRRKMMRYKRHPSPVSGVPIMSVRLIPFCSWRRMKNFVARLEDPSRLCM